MHSDTSGLAYYVAASRSRGGVKEVRLRCNRCGAMTNWTTRSKLICGCNAARDMYAAANSVVAELPEDSRKLLGDRVKDLTEAIGIPTCSGCESRRIWLNKADAWIRRTLSGG